MQRWSYWGICILCLIALAACHKDDSNKPVVPENGPGRVNLSVTGRVGTYVGEEMTDYVKSLHVFLFRESTGGTYVLAQHVFYDKEQLAGLALSNTAVSAGYTNARNINFDNLPLGTYRIAGVGNMTDSTGAAWDYADLSGIETGNTMEEVIASVTSGHTSPRIFFGQTESFVLGSALPANPSLTLFRKVSMFALTLQKVPAVVERIDMEIQNTYGAFNMTGDYLSDRVISVNYTRNYRFTEEQDTLPVTVVTLPSVTGRSSEVTLIFYLQNGQVINIPLQKPYTLKPNTITKLTATINADQSGGQWTVDLTITVSVDVEWNVDQEPEIII